MPEQHTVAVHLDAADCRYRAALTGWAVAAGWPSAHAGLDGVALTACLLWDKIGRAIRAEVDPALGAREAASLGQGGGVGAAPVAAAPAVTLRGRVRQLRQTATRHLRGAPMLLCPFPYSRHARMIEAVRTHAPDVAIGVPAAYAANWPGAVAIPWPRPASPAPAAGAQRHAAVLAGLQTCGVRLLPDDCARLATEIGAQEQTLAEAAAALDAIRPAAVLVPVDNHSPFLEYVVQARRRGIPTLLMQHGLDCEWFALDEAQASHIAVWGPNRADRYRRDSHRQPEQMPCVGNPHYDDAPAPVAPTDHGVWLWVTRPHRPEKCYLPSRRPDEGLRILDALLAALAECPQARLLIKAHTFDDVDRYRERLAAAGRARAAFSDDALPNLLARAGVVISEDSTAGMDAMRANRPLVHAHFASSPPVMPFVDYGAAHPGFDAEQLAASLLTPPATDLRPGQQRFLDDFAGPRDGAAAHRFARFAAEVLNRR